ncbi:T9SS type A sorting domain-containing protein [Candidatus Amoebophilus asiaticus]|nr:T9SS type A sorting domain-containing protein [Candidatus Amoebophilus asiaticus]
MKKRSLYIFIVTSFLLLLSYQIVTTYSSGPPGGRTGAPGDATCISIGCHTGTVNTGSGTPSITIGGGDTTYMASQTYTITVSITQTGITKFGFQIVVLDANNNNTGTITITNTTKTQTAVLSGRIYAEHKSAGTSSSSWSFDWTSPSTDVGAITFFAAFVAANGDLTSSGDLIYTTSSTISPSGFCTTGVVISSNTNNILCNGDSDGSASVSLTGGTLPYTYSWSNLSTDSFATGLSAGSFDLTVTDGLGCDTIISINITEPDSISLSMTTTNETQVGDDATASASASGGTLPYTYSWSNGGTDSTITGLAADIYTVTVSDANGCFAISTDTIDMDVGVTECKCVTQQVWLYPNPTRGILNIQIGAKQATETDITIYNILGERLYHENIWNDKLHQIDFQNLGWQDGIYFISLQNQLFYEIKPVILTK